MQRQMVIASAVIETCEDDAQRMSNLHSSSRFMSLLMRIGAQPRLRIMNFGLLARRRHRRRLLIFNKTAVPPAGYALRRASDARTRARNSSTVITVSGGAGATGTAVMGIGVADIAFTSVAAEDAGSGRVAVRVAC